MTTQTEEEAIEAFCKELALALRRITGSVVESKPGDLPVPMKEFDPESPQIEEGATNAKEMEEDEEPSTASRFSGWLLTEYIG